jgi:hypothetical protein
MGAGVRATLRELCHAAMGAGVRATLRELCRAAVGAGVRATLRELCRAALKELVWCRCCPDAKNTKNNNRS